MHFMKYERNLNNGITKCPVESSMYMLVQNFLDELFEHLKISVISAVGLHKNTDFRLETLAGISDIYIVSSDFKYKLNQGECLGCIEIKSPTEELKHTEQIIFQSKSLSNVIYTNGIIWEYYKDSNLEWKINLSVGTHLNSIKNIKIDHEKYYELIIKLLDIKWQ
ncbi:hypothetical protein [Macrococcus epidermidis]|uniref:hypothetical protein n=1 Tax=Macrococcus epidermidis TaxID=1902580 RepID=UPI0020B6A8EB|nr:hypothetical protein [Macrococcus epidermidis]UTH15050.1 hypothetical protein KFV12_06825 [Macrococcus epidermidis]